MKPTKKPWRSLHRICPLCQQELPNIQEVVAADKFLLEQILGTGDFQSCAIHYHCFQNWEHRKEYIRLFNQHHRDIDTRFSYRMKANGRIECSKHKSG